MGKNTLNVLLTFISIISFASLFGMEQSPHEQKKYTVGVKIPNSTYTGKMNPVHMTITYLGTVNSKTLEAAKSVLSTINSKRPFNIKIGKTDQFGSKEHPVRVKRVLIENPELEKLLIQMHQKLSVCEPFQKEKHDTPNWHISMKNPDLEQEFSKLEGAIIKGGKLFIKPLGKFDPI